MLKWIDLPGGAVPGSIANCGVIELCLEQSDTESGLHAVFYLWVSAAWTTERDGDRV